MPKLFVAIGLPAAATAALERIQPPPSAGIRLAEQNQMHLTLHYVGEADVESIAVALEVLAFQRFSLTLEGVGQFHSSGGAVTLWAGVRENADLLGLRTVVAAALAESGFRPEARRYAPHITLARCEPGAATDLTAEFLARQTAFRIADVPVAAFGLFSSTLVGRSRCISVSGSSRCWSARLGAKWFNSRSELDLVERGRASLRVRERRADTPDGRSSSWFQVSS
jgi:2'-5' RNA ligase